jgi:hypothetical protein
MMKAELSDNREREKKVGERSYFYETARQQMPPPLSLGCI